MTAPGSARDDWEILRDLIFAVSGSNGLHSIEDVFKAMASATPTLAGLTLSRIGDLGVDLDNRELPPTAGHVVPPTLPTL